MRFLTATALSIIGLLIIASQVLAVSPDPFALFFGFVLMGGGLSLPAPAPDVARFARHLWRAFGEIAGALPSVFEGMLNALDWLSKGMWPLRKAVPPAPAAPAHKPTLAVGSRPYYIDRILTALRNDPDYDATDALIAELHVELGGKVNASGRPLDPSTPADQARAVFQVPPQMMGHPGGSPWNGKTEYQR